MPDLWKGIAQQITELESKRAPEAQWKQAADVSQPITNRDQLLEALRSLPQEAKDKGLTAFSSAAKAVHYGFDCDFHAIVFFAEDGSSTFVIKW